MPSIGVPSGCGVLVYMVHDGDGAVALYGAGVHDGDNYRFHVYNRQGQYLGLSSPDTDGDMEYFVWEYRELLNACLKDISDEVVLEDSRPNVKPVLRFDCSIGSLSELIGRKLYLTRYPLLSSLFASLPINSLIGCIFNGVYIELFKTDENNLDISTLSCGNNGSEAMVAEHPINYYEFTGVYCDEQYTLDEICNEWSGLGITVNGYSGEAEMHFPALGVNI